MRKVLANQGFVLQDAAEGAVYGLTAQVAVVANSVAPATPDPGATLINPGVPPQPPR